MPSAKYSCSGSPDMFWNGSTAMEGLSGSVRALGRSAGISTPSILLVMCAALGFAGAVHASPPDPGPLNHSFWPHRGRLGVQVQDMTPELRKHFGAPADRGILVSRVESERPGARAGIEVGDTIVDAGGEPIGHVYDLIRAVGRVPAGGSLEILIVRDQEEQSLSIEPGGAAAEWVDPQRWPDLLNRGMRRGRDELLRRLEGFEERLHDLERRLEHPSAHAPTAT